MLSLLFRWTYVNGIKACSVCWTFKPFSEFYSHKETRDKLTNRCKACDRAANRRWCASNEERRNLQRKKWKQNNKDKQCKYSKKWKDKNKSRDRAYTRAYAARKSQACPPWANTKEMYLRIAAHYEHAAWLSSVAGFEFHVDHIIPIHSDFVCGLHVPWNLQVLEACDNTAKGSRWWPGQLNCQKGRGVDHQWWIELYEQLEQS
jgi:hypothetical protein